MHWNTFYVHESNAPTRKNMSITDKQFIYPCDDSPSLGTQYTGPSSLLSKEEKDSWDDQEEGEGCSATEGGSMKLQLKVFSGSWWATENRKQTAQPKGQPKGIVPPHKNNSLFSLTPPQTWSKLMFPSVWGKTGSFFYWYCMRVSKALNFMKDIFFHVLYLYLLWCQKSSQHQGNTLVSLRFKYRM